MPSKIFEKIMQKSYSDRRKVAFMITGVVGVGIMTAWIAITGHNIKQAVKPSQEDIKAAEQYQQELKEKTYRTKIINEEQLQKMRGVKVSPSPTALPTE